MPGEDHWAVRQLCQVCPWGGRPRSTRGVTRSPCGALCQSGRAFSGPSAEWSTQVPVWLHALPGVGDELGRVALPCDRTPGVLLTAWTVPSAPRQPNEDISSTRYRRGVDVHTVGCLWQRHHPGCPFGRRVMRAAAHMVRRTSCVVRTSCLYEYDKGSSMTRSYASLGLAAALSSVLLLAGCGGSDSGAASSAPSAPASVPPAAAGSSGTAGGSGGSGAAGDAGSNGTGNGAAAGQAPQPAQSTNPSGGYWPATVQLGHNDRLGNTVVDGEGFTLYRFDPDSANPSKATCVGDCAVTWPPVLANDKIVFQRLYRDKISTVTRPDGTQQVTIGGWPVYRFSKDTAAGEIKGEGVGGTWFAVAPDGTKAKDSRD
ncbi:hypothetical protein ACWDWS_28275 [Streptomyces sp. NPDC003328]